MNDLLLLMPIVICALTGVLVMALDLLSGRTEGKGFLGYVTALGLGSAALAAVMWWRGVPVFEAPYLSGMLLTDTYAAFFALLILGAGAAAALFSVDHLREQGFDGGEHYALLAFSTAGALAFISANDLITLFLGLEIMSLAVYVMAAGKRSSAFAAEAGMKYFILGGLASAFLLFGVALLYGATGKLDLSGIVAGLRGAHEGGAVLPQVAMVMLLVALGFKAAVVPFHQWTPDVYEGAPTPVTVYMAGAIKAAAFAVLARLLLSLFPAGLTSEWPLTLRDALLFLAVLTMVVGNVLGIVQDNVKRILAYSSIAHAGYILLGVWATGATGDLNDGVPFYLLGYVVATVGAFGVVSLLGARGEEDMSLGRFAGLGRRHPVLALILMVCVLSLAGIPPLAGFLGKFYLFKQVLAADPDGNVVWVVVAVLNSLLALYYYLRIVLYAYFREPEGEPAPAIRSVPGYVAAGIAALIVIWVGLFPGQFLAASTHVASMAVVGGPHSHVASAPATRATALPTPATAHGAGRRPVEAPQELRRGASPAALAPDRKLEILRQMREGRPDAVPFTRRAPAPAPAPTPAP